MISIEDLVQVSRFQNNKKHKRCHEARQCCWVTDAIPSSSWAQILPLQQILQLLVPDVANWTQLTDRCSFTTRPNATTHFQPWYHFSSACSMSLCLVEVGSSFSTSKRAGDIGIGHTCEIEKINMIYVIFVLLPLQCSISNFPFFSITSTSKIYLT